MENRELDDKINEGPEKGQGEEEGVFPASAGTPGQLVSRATYARFIESRENFPWWEVYLELRARGWDWRKAVYIAWMAVPTSKRFPKTLQALAVEVLGLRSDSTIRQWRRKEREKKEKENKEEAILKAIEMAQTMLAGDALSDVMEAWVEVAKTPHPAAHPDRKMYLEWKGVYQPKQGVEMSGPGGNAMRLVQVDVELERLSQMTPEDQRKYLRQVGLAALLSSGEARDDDGGE